ncbi:sugar phosphate isomerase/epimerase [Pseudomonas tolaasii]|uniref:Sugar phosphate isomerase/epimerase n=2 Tax=Pseudomonas tolaasii TaxID=29442 RepID=A0A7Y8AHR0_PSETO|nr:xylose isomerase [Pseudomonas tolaasii]ARB28065.1 xylose isomerase [Pseudomonas tolaasii]KAB0467790.1 sugar phosphate isomerase/epimerase [Pseudomonas tolaasii]MBY8943518.1 sugar phosphate isomerase/epimerase [Pseudomonas tolaasii]NWC19397.1 sugar phosphate isomerase/epimerase [Pseudomonas tolaasii]NWC43086.1 sugar phosphate isomerase/epimerase [Pseudomonas tolaasii]
MREFLVFQSMWAMQIEPGALDAQLDRIKAAGFDGVTDHYWKPADVARLHAAASARGLQVEGQLFPQSVGDLAAALDVISRYGCHHLTLQADVRPRSQAEAVRLIEGWQRLAEQVDFPVLLETHRYRLTSDLLFTLDLLAHMPDLKLLADLSHYVVGRELPESGTVDDDRHIHEILRHSWGFHGRIASSEQVQVSLDFPQHQAWVKRFTGWWRYGIEHWLSRTETPQSLSFTCELGPPPYAITGADGHELTDRWAEALKMKTLIREVWQSCQR